MYGCFAFIHIVMGTVYGFYYWGLAGSTYGLTCVTNQTTFTPYKWQSDEDLSAFLDRPGS